MIVCVWAWVSEGIPCFAFVNFYILRGRRSNLCDCTVYVKVITCFFIVFICSMVPMLLFRWCVQRILIASGSIRGSLSSHGLVGFSYLVESAGI